MKHGKVAIKVSNPFPLVSFWNQPVTDLHPYIDEVSCLPIHSGLKMNWAAYLSDSSWVAVEPKASGEVGELNTDANLICLTNRPMGRLIRDLWKLWVLGGRSALTRRPPPPHHASMAKSLDGNVAWLLRAACPSVCRSVCVHPGMSSRSLIFRDLTACKFFSILKL